MQLLIVALARTEFHLTLLGDGAIFWKRNCRYACLLSYTVGKFYLYQAVAVFIRLHKRHLCASEMWHL